MAERQLIRLVRLYRAGLCVWEVLEIRWEVLEWITRNPSAKQDPCLVHLLLVRRLQQPRPVSYTHLTLPTKA